MVNEPLPWQMTVGELIDALAVHEVNAVVVLVEPGTAGGRSVVRNLRLTPGQSPTSPVVRFEIQGTPGR